MTEAGSVYGLAMYELAASEGLAEEILQQLDMLLVGFEAEPEFLRLLNTPALSKEERCKILDDSFRGKVHPYVLNFLKILTEKGYIRQYPHCCKAYRQQYYHDNGIISVQAVTAIPLTADQLQRLTRKMKSVTGKNILLQNRVDPSCMGGIRLDYDGKRLDDTISHRLEAVGSLLKNTVL